MAKRIRLPDKLRNVPEQALSPPERHSSRAAAGLGTSAMVHGILLLILSLLVVSQRPESDRPIAFLSFDDNPGDQESPTLLPDSLEAQIAETDSTEPAPAEPVLTTPLPVESLEIDLAAIRSDLNTTAVPNPVYGAAENIQLRVQRAGGETGEVQFSLSWHSFNDLDLHVIAPSGERIAWHHRDSRCHGRLDVDMNVEPTTDDPVENVRWLERAAPTGRYTVLVHQFRWSFPERTDPFQLLVNLGDEVQLVEQKVDAGSPIAVVRFQYVRPILKESRREEIRQELTAMQLREDKQATTMLERALEAQDANDRQTLLRRIIRQFPHTDASIQAMQHLPPDTTGKAAERGPDRANVD